MQTQERVIFCSTNFVSFFRNRFVVISAARGHVWFPRISSLSTIVDAPMARFTVRRGRRRSGRTVSGALHCTPETPPRGASFHPPSTTPWRASLYAGDGGALRRCSSIVGDPMVRFTVRRGRRRSAQGRENIGLLAGIRCPRLLQSGEPITVWGLQPMSPCGRPAISSG